MRTSEFVCENGGGEHPTARIFTAESLEMLLRGQGKVDRLVACARTAAQVFNQVRGGSDFSIEGDGFCFAYDDETECASLSGTEISCLDYQQVMIAPCPGDFQHPSIVVLLQNSDGSWRVLPIESKTETWNGGVTTSTMNSKLSQCVAETVSGLGLAGQCPELSSRISFNPKEIYAIEKVVGMMEMAVSQTA